MFNLKGNSPNRKNILCVYVANFYIKKNSFSKTLFSIFYFVVSLY